MASFEQKFGDDDEFVVTLEISPGLTQGWVNSDGFGATLDWLLDNGTLTCGGEEMVVPQDIIDEIDEWAEENGY